MKAPRRLAGRLAAMPLLALIWTYRMFLSPLLGANCRYLPGCSDYASAAIHVHGPVAGSILALKRIARCHPWGGSGFDPVPDRAARAKFGQGTGR